MYACQPLMKMCVCTVNSMPNIKLPGERNKRNNDKTISFNGQMWTMGIECMCGAETKRNQIHHIFEALSRKRGSIAYIHKYRLYSCHSWSGYCMTNALDVDA